MSVNVILCFILLMSLNMDRVNCVINDVDPKYFCENPDHLDEHVLRNIHKCYCEPYDASDMEGKPSIVRFPVCVLKCNFLSS